GRAGQWLPIPVRPEPPSRDGEAPVWSGAAQQLEPISGSARGASTRRVATAELSNAARAAAAGKGTPPAVAPVGRVRHSGSSRTRRLEIDVAIGVSNRHVHLSPEHARQLFGKEPTVLRTISQPGQFAANETVAVVGPKGRIDAVRVVGPARGQTQLEIAFSDARGLGIDATLAASGSLQGSAGGVTLHGTAGNVTLTGGVIVAARHLHLSAEDAGRWGIANGDRLDVTVGHGARATTFHQVLVRSGPTHATELHLDADEAFAAGVKTGDRARIVAVAPRGAARRQLITERDVVRIAREGGSLPERAILTPSALDRARALGLRPAE
ncbi:MAG TPA: PduL/EutD family phosphate acyltransferase, partial [Gemmatimonadaceae bacterium]